MLPKTFIVRVSVSEGCCVTVGSPIDVTYYGQPCSLRVTRLVATDGVDVTHNDLSHSARNTDTISERGLSEQLQQVSLGKSASLADCRQFFQITSQTKLYFQSENDETKDFRAGYPHLEDVGGLDIQIATIQEMIQAHLFSRTQGGIYSGESVSVS